MSVLNNAAKKKNRNNGKSKFLKQKIIFNLVVLRLGKHTFKRKDLKLNIFSVVKTKNENGNLEVELVSTKRSI